MAVGNGVTVAVGSAVDVGAGGIVGVAEGVIAGVGGGRVKVATTAVVIKVGLGETAVAIGCVVQPMINKKSKVIERGRLFLHTLLPGKFAGVFFHQAFVIAAPDICFTGHRFYLNIGKTREQVGQ